MRDPCLPTRMPHRSDMAMRCAPRQAGRARLARKAAPPHVTAHRACRRQGARFAKWRAALKVAPGCPSDLAVELNAQQLAQYAAICQVSACIRPLGCLPACQPAGQPARECVAWLRQHCRPLWRCMPWAFPVLLRMMSIPRYRPTALPPYRLALQRRTACSPGAPESPPVLALRMLGRACRAGRPVTWCL